MNWNMLPVWRIRPKISRALNLLQNIEHRKGAKELHGTKAFTFFRCLELDSDRNWENAQNCPFPFHSLAIVQSLTARPIFLSFPEFFSLP